MDVRHESPSDPVAAHGDSLPGGAEVGRYLVLRRVGAGSRGVVYAAYDPELNRRVALKLLGRAESAPRALAKLSHPHVLPIYDVGDHAGRVFVAMEFVEGGTLADWLDAESRPTEAVVRLFRQAGEGLAAAHAAGIVHGGFEAKRVLVGRDGRARVTDFQPAPESEEVAFSVAGDVRAFSRSLQHALQSSRLSSQKSRRVPGRLRRALRRALAGGPEQHRPSLTTLLHELRPPGPARARIFAFVLAMLVVAAGVIALRRPAAPVCQGAVAEWGDVFDSAMQERVHEALLRTHDPSADPAFASVRGSLSKYRAAWIAMHTEACRSTQERGQQSAAVLDLRMRCLDERRIEVRSFVQSIESGASAGLVARAMDGVNDLPRVDDCAVTRALTEPVPLPADPLKRGRIVALSRRAAEVEGEAVAAAESLAAIEPLLLEARQLAWKPLIARLLFDHASRQSRLRMNREAEIELHEAVLVAEEAHADAIVSDVETRLLYLVGYQEHRVEEGLLWGRYAEAELTRVGGDDRRAGRIHKATGLVLLNDESRLEEARSQFEQAIELAKKADGSRSADVARGMQGVSMVLFTMGRRKEALPFERSAREINEGLFGPEGIDIAVSLGNEGEDRNDSSLLNVVARALRSKGNASEALEVDRRAFALAEKNEPPESYELSFANLDLAMDLLQLGRPKEALPFAERAARFRSVTQSPSERGEARFLLARVLFENGERERARHEAEAARPDFVLVAARYGGKFQAALDAIDAWLLSRPR